MLPQLRVQLADADPAEHLQSPEFDAGIGCWLDPMHVALPLQLCILSLVVRERQLAVQRPHHAEVGNSADT